MCFYASLFSSKVDEILQERMPGIAKFHFKCFCRSSWLYLWWALWIKAKIIFTACPRSGSSIIIKMEKILGNGWALLFQIRHFCLVLQWVIYFPYHARSSIPTLLYSPWEKISYSKSFKSQQFSINIVNIT